jgi:hypothetical protein
MTHFFVKPVSFHKLFVFVNLKDYYNTSIVNPFIHKTSLPHLVVENQHVFIVLTLLCSWSVVVNPSFIRGYKSIQKINILKTVQRTSTNLYSNMFLIHCCRNLGLQKPIINDPPKKDRLLSDDFRCRSKF